MKLKEKISAFFARDWVVFLFLFVVTLLLYANTLNVPFYFDDIPQIVKRASIYDLNKAFKAFFNPRGIVDITFALNYHFFGMSLPAFHAVNIFLHFLTTCIVFLILKRVFKASRLACYFGAIVFLVHPLQTQTVNYIVQRLAGMSGFFLFLGLYLFIKAKEECRDKGFHSVRHITLYLSFVLVATIAVLAKQNTATIPALYLLFESVFLMSDKREPLLKRIIYLLPTIIAPAWLGYKMVLAPMFGGKTMTMIGNFENLTVKANTVEMVKATPLRYFVTELSVFWIYIKLLFVPIPQVLDYGYPVVDKIVSFKNFIAATGLFSVLAIAGFFRDKLPLFFFSVYWFCLALVVESTFIPLDPVFEHRMYIPMLGFSVLLSAFFLWMTDCGKMKNGALTAAVVVCLFLVFLTVKRNYVWADPIKLYQADVANTYGSYRPALMLADEYYQRGQLQKAKVEYDQIVQKIETLGVKNIQSKMLLNVAVAYGRFNDFAKAESLLRLALKSAPKVSAVHYNLGIALYLQGRLSEAYQSFTLAWKLDDGKHDAFYYVILLSAKLGKDVNMIELLDEMQRINPKYAAKLRFDLGIFDR